MIRKSDTATGLAAVVGLAVLLLGTAAVVATVSDSTHRQSAIEDGIQEDTPQRPLEVPEARDAEVIATDFLRVLAQANGDDLTGVTVESAYAESPVELSPKSDETVTLEVRSDGHRMGVTVSEYLNRVVHYVDWDAHEDEPRQAPAVAENSTERALEIVDMLCPGWSAELRLLGRRAERSNTHYAFERVVHGVKTNEGLVVGLDKGGRLVWWTAREWRIDADEVARALEQALDMNEARDRLVEQGIENPGNGKLTYRYNLVAVDPGDQREREERFGLFYAFGNPPRYLVDAGTGMLVETLDMDHMPD